MDKSKAAYQDFRAVAQWITDAPADLDGVRVQLAPSPNVQIMEDGAFVDAVIWVPNAIKDIWKNR